MACGAAGGVAATFNAPLAGAIFQSVAQRYPRLETPRHIHESLRRMIDALVNDMLAESKRRLVVAGVDSAAAVRAAEGRVVAFSEAMAEDVRGLKEFLFDAVYRHHKVNRMTTKAKTVVSELFALFVERPDCLPADWRKVAESADARSRAVLVSDYIAGMTDRYALEEHRRLFDPYTAIH